MTQPAPDIQNLSKIEAGKLDLNISQVDGTTVTIELPIVAAPMTNAQPEPADA